MLCRQRIKADRLPIPVSGSINAARSSSRLEPSSWLSIPEKWLCNSSISSSLGTLLISLISCLATCCIRFRRLLTGLRINLLSTTCKDASSTRQLITSQNPVVIRSSVASVVTSFFGINASSTRPSSNGRRRTRNVPSGSTTSSVSLWPLRQPSGARPAIKAFDLSSNNKNIPCCSCCFKNISPNFRNE